MINTNQLKQIIQDLTNLAGEDVSQEIIFQEACSYHRGMLANESRIGKPIENKSQNPPIQIEPPTDKQKLMLRRLGVKEIPNSKQEARLIIKDIMDNQNGNQ